MSNSETTTVKFVLRSFAAKGKGKAWVAECFKPWTPGDSSCVKYINPSFGDEFTLRTGSVYRAHEPMEVEVEDEYDETRFTSRDYYIVVHPNEEVEEINDSHANYLLRKLESSKKQPHQVAPRSVSTALTLTATLQGDKLMLVSASGKVSFTLPSTVLRKLAGGRDGGQ